MKFSICIPNYNYGAYIGTTIASVLDQHVDVEVIVADNASTDDSVAVVRSFGDDRIRLIRNPWNVGFAGNLDRASASATGEHMILLSSDDVANPGALATYERILAYLGEDAQHTVVCSSQNVIDSDGVVTEIMHEDPRLWAGSSRDPILSEVAGFDVILAESSTILRNSLRNMRNPFHFATTCYSRSAYDNVVGYGGAKIINPDKHFAWKLLARTTRCIHVRAPLFGYRVHPANQGAQMAQSGALKHLVDQYVFSFDTAPEILRVAKMSKSELAEAFVEHDIALRGLKLLAEGKRIDARRTLRFGQATYPSETMRNRKALALRGLLALGPLGTAAAHSRYKRALANFRNEAQSG